MRRLFRVVLALAAPLCVGILFGCSVKQQTTASTVRIAVPYDEQYSNLNEGYYKAWLEEQSGQSIEFTFLPQTHTQEYLRILLSGRDSNVDAVFFSQESAPDAGELAQYGEKGTLVALDTLLEQRGTFLPAVFASHTAYSLRRAMEAPDGHIYYMPALEASATPQHLQTLWMNVGWLEELDLTLPATTQEFADTLKAFAQAHPLGVAAMGSAQADSTNLCHFLMNSFTLCDPVNSYLAVEDGAVFFPPVSDAWRDGLRYCRSLYRDGLLPSEHFTFTKNQLIGVVNDPGDLVGCFPSQQLSDIIFMQSPQLVSKFLALPPLTGPNGKGCAVVHQRMPRVGGVILSSSQKAEEVFALMDLMCSEEAFLIGHYGQEGVNWEFSQPTETTMTGTPAVITVTKRHVPQRDTQTDCVIGPFVARAKYADGVVWKGYPINQSEAINARASRLYEPYEPQQFIPAILFEHDASRQTEQLLAIKSYTAQWMKAFITGEENVEDDTVWSGYVGGFVGLKLPELLGAVQTLFTEGEVD